MLEVAAVWLGMQVFGVGYGCYPARCIVPANHLAHEFLFKDPLGPLGPRLWGVYILEAWKVICRNAILRFPMPMSSLLEHKMVLRQISCCQVKQVWKILIQRSRSEARPYILLLIHFILLFRPSISPLLIEYFMAFLMGEMSRWTLFTKLTTSP